MGNLDNATAAGVGIDQPAPDQSGIAAPEATTAPEATPEEAPAEYTPEQVAAWRTDAENKAAWQKAYTERDQQLAQMKAQAEYERQAFQNDPNNQLVMRARALMAQDPSLYPEVAQFVASGGKQTGPVDPFIGQLANNLRQSEDRLRGLEYKIQEEDRARVEAQATAHVREFRENHAEDFPDTPEGEKAFGEFYKRAMAETDAANLEHAHRILNYDAIIARARESARTEMDGVELEKGEAASGIQPGAHEEEGFDGYRGDGAFRKARERAMEMDNNDYDEE